MFIKLLAPIYEENIVSLTYEGDVIRFTYNDDEQIGRRHSLVFTCVYWYEFTDFEIMSVHDWKFGLELVEFEESQILNGKLKNILAKHSKSPYFVSLCDLKHYRLVVDDYGEIEIICQSVEMITI